MTRRIVRTAINLAILAVLSLVTILFLDSRFRVLPNAIHGYLPAHHAGYVVTDITLTKCSSANLFSKCTTPRPSTYWHRIEKELYLGKGWITKAYVHVQRMREEELGPGDKVVLDVRVGGVDPGLEEIASVAGKDRKDTENKWESRPGGIWIKRSEGLKEFDNKNAVTGVDVLFGADAVDPREGWEIRDQSLALGGTDDGLEARISIRRGQDKAPEKPIPRIQENGKFKIMQLADLHLATGLGICRDPMPEDGKKCEADTRTLEFVGRLLDEEKPNLVILSGDQVNGDTAPDAQSAIFKYAELLIKRQIPYASIFGNHDDEGSLPRASQMELIETLPYSLSRAGPEELDGVGNYYIEVLARGTSSHSALTLYLLDTHAYSPDEHHYKGYDWLKKSQIDWFTSTAESLKKSHKEYTGIHMNLAFIHIPLPEYSNTENEFVGNWKEGVTAPAFNSGFQQALIEQDVKLVSCGHDHVNEYCMLARDVKHTPALWMCYGGGAGFGGYGGYGGFHRRVRFFEIDMNESKISTYKRVEWGALARRVDEQVVVKDGRVVAPVSSAVPTSTRS